MKFVLIIFGEISFQTIAGNVCSETMQQFLIYSRDLGFYDKPDYAHLKKMLSNELDKHQFENDGDFDWRRVNLMLQFKAKIRK